MPDHVPGMHAASEGIRVGPITPAIQAEGASRRDAMPAAAPWAGEERCGEGLN